MKCWDHDHYLLVVGAVAVELVAAAVAEFAAAIVAEAAAGVADVVCHSVEGGEKFVKLEELAVWPWLERHAAIDTSSCCDLVVVEH